MSLVLFTKSLSDHDVAQLIERGHALGVDGFDLCVRAGHLAAKQREVLLPFPVRDARVRVTDRQGRPAACAKRSRRYAGRFTTSTSPRVSVPYGARLTR